VIGFDEGDADIKWVLKVRRWVNIGHKNKVLLVAVEEPDNIKFTSSISLL